MEKKQLQELKILSAKIRLNILEMLEKRGYGHLIWLGSRGGSAIEEVEGITGLGDHCGTAVSEHGVGPGAGGTGDGAGHGTHCPP